MRGTGILLWLVAAAGGEPVEPRTTVAIVIDEKVRVPRRAGEAMRAEFERILALGGVDWKWHRLAERISANRVVVVRVWPLPATTPAATLAFTHISDGAILPFVSFDPARVERLLEAECRLLDPAGCDDLLGRSLGRVLAHEVYHVLADTTSHGRSGVTKGAFRLGDLLAAHLDLGPRAIERIDSQLGGGGVAIRAAAGETPQTWPLSSPLRPGREGRSSFSPTH
jgi:hypothetical protein